MSEQLCRWGILGAATIARKNWQSIRLAGNATLVAVASRDIDRSKAFIDQCQAHVPFPDQVDAMGDYDALLARDDIDAVYIPLPTAVRKPWVIKAARAGKHVMCEKPVGVTAADVEEMLAACDMNNVQFMDGVMFMHSKRLELLRERLDDGESVGQIKRIATQFSFCAPDDWIAENIRTSSNLEPHGCLGDLGWYTIRIALVAMKGQLPQRVSGRILTEKARGDSPQAVPAEFSGELFFEGGVSAGFYCSFLTEHQQWVHISGSKGSLAIRDFVLPCCSAETSLEVSQPVFDLNGCDFVMEDHSRRYAVPEYSHSHATSQETNLFRQFSALVLSGRIDNSWGKIALDTQKVLDACLASGRDGGTLVEIN
ncbi:MAG: Gfo/Idh/MocA family oxidoreductase [Planctomycetales bacterium]|nr:Gfo/Idh/MocA family oxidoreductase [Planctomycetales bacterium]